jgi:spermidine synthase
MSRGTKILVFTVGAFSMAGQVTWSRLAATAVGGTFAAWAITLFGAMAGLSLGAAWAGMGSRRLAPILAACGVTLMTTPFLILAISRLEGIPAVRAFLTMLLLGAAHLPFGAFLPSVIVWRKLEARDLGTLYALGSLGAVAGALGAGEILLTVIAMDHLGILLGLITLGLLGLLCPPAEGVAPPIPVERCERVPRVLLISVFALGALGLVTESLWMRVLGFYWESSTLCFALVTAATVGGLSVGAWAAGRLSRRTKFGRPALAIVLGASSLCLAGAAAASPLAVAATTSVERIGTTLLLVGLPASLFGATFVLLLGCTGAGNPARAVGLLSGANSAGAAAGPLLLWAGAPWVSWPPQMLVFIAGGYAALIAAVADRRVRLTGLGLAATLVLAGLALSPSGPALTDLHPMVQTNSEFDTVTMPFLHTSLDSTVAVTRETRTGIETVWIDRGAQGDTTALGRRIPERLGRLPCELLGRPPRKAMVIGLGMGLTLSAMVDSGAASVDVAELSPGIIDANRTVLAERNNQVLANAAVQLRHGDGRPLLLDAGTSYDLIMTDIMHPTVLGAGNLFSREFYALARRRLAPDGVFVHWLPGFLLSPEDLSAVTSAFLEAFPEGSMWVGYFAPRALVLGLVGGKVHPLLPPQSAGLKLLGPAELRHLAAGAAPIRDGDPRLEKRSRKNGDGRFGVANLQRLMVLMEGSPWALFARGCLAELDGDLASAAAAFKDATAAAPGQTDAEFHLSGLAVERHLQAAHEASTRRDSEAMLRSLRSAAASTSSSAGNIYLADVLAARGRLEEAAGELKKAVAKSPRAADARLRLALIARELGDDETARREFDLASALRERQSPWPRPSR